MKQPIWVRGRVPNGYWSTRPNRLKYLQWLGQRLGFRRPNDWYRLTRRSFLENYGGGLLATVYNHSPLAALRDYAPGHDWKPWLLQSTPQGYWKKRDNRAQYMRWLGKQLGFTRDTDWYSLSQQHFHDHDGAGLLGVHYRNSPIDAVRDFKPGGQWLPWLFVAAPQGFWKKKANRVAYLKWLGRELGFKKPDDWYALQRHHFYDNAGGALLHTIPGRSPLAALREAFPKAAWQEWRFARVPNGYWKKKANRCRFIDALGKELGFRKPADWYRLTRQQVRDAGGGALLMMRYHNSVLALLRDRFPQITWDAHRLYGRAEPGTRRLAA